MKKLFAAIIAVPFLLLGACNLVTPGADGTPTPLQSSLADAQSVLDRLNATPSGANILAWAKGGISQVKGDVVAFNAALPGGGLSVPKVQALCGADNSLHTLLQVVLPFIPSVGGTAAGVDAMVYGGIQDGCALATGGTMPSVTQIGTMVDAFGNAATALGIKL